jgi:hypothetical protein
MITSLTNLRAYLRPQYLQWNGFSLVSNTLSVHLGLPPWLKDTSYDFVRA